MIQQWKVRQKYQILVGVGYAELSEYLQTKEQTPEICLAAIKQNPYVLKYVKEHVKQSAEFQNQLGSLRNSEENSGGSTLLNSF